LEFPQIGQTYYIDKNQEIIMSKQTEEKCIMCNCGDLSHSTEESTFKFGIGNKKDTIHAVIPILTCNKCGFSFTSEEGNNAEHNAVCAHLERLNPTEILCLRNKLELTQEQLGKLTKFNSSSIHRWETGEKIQSPSSDQMLRVVNKLYSMFGNAEQVIEFLKINDKTKTKQKYDWDASPEERVAASEFKLRRVA
jgi:putative zinc finger/helix-turn-helix YgiT family protein